MKGDSRLTKAEREMIAVVVSVANDCAYCVAAHSAALRKLTKDPALADAIAADHATASVDARVRAMLAYSVKLTVQPKEMSEADLQALRDAGWTDEDVMDIAEVNGHVQHVEPNGVRPRLVTEPGVRDARALT